MATDNGKIPVTQSRAYGSNPYRSPSESDDSPGIATPVNDNDQPLDADDLTRVRRGVTVTMAGVFVPVVCATAGFVVSILAGHYSTREVLAIPLLLGIALVSALAICGVLVPAGVMMCNRVHGQHRSLGWLGLLLFAVGGTASVGTLLRIFAGTRLLGLAPLLAASTYSTWLTGLALLTMSFRHWSIRCNSNRSARVLEFAVLSFAVSGVSASVSVLSPAALGTFLNGPLIGILGLAVIPAFWLLFFGLVLLQRDWRRAESITRTD